MTEAFEDPRKTSLRERLEQAADAAGYDVDLTRPLVALPQGSGLEGGIKADVVALGTDGVTRLCLIRVEGGKALPGWIRNCVAASASLAKTEVIIVVEEVGEQLKSTCVSAGAGLLVLSEANTLEVVLEYGPPDKSNVRKAFDKEVKAVRRRLQSKLDLNTSNLENSFHESFAVTATMQQASRADYLNSIEAGLVAWRDWGEAMSERLDAVASDGDLEELKAIEKDILKGPPSA